MPKSEDFLYQLGGVRPVTLPSTTRYVVTRADGKPMYESTMRSVAELYAFVYAPASATVEVVS